MVVGEEGDFVFLSDGRLKSVDKPKRKRKKHIQPISNKVEPELISALQSGIATNEQVKFAIKQQCKQNQ